MSVLGAAAIGLGGSVLSGLIGKSGISSQNKANAQQAQLNRDFQEKMSSTAHQRATADLRAAGLNPILSATKGGASTPSGAQAQIQNELEPMANSAKDIAMQLAQIRLLNAQTEKTQNEADINKPKAEVFGRLGNFINSILPDDSSAKGLQATIDKYSNTTKVHPSPKRTAHEPWHKSKAQPKKQAAHYSTFTKKQINWFKQEGYKYSKKQNRWIK